MIKEGDRVRVRADSTDWNAQRWCRLHPDRTGYVYRVVEAYVCLDASSGVIPMADLELYIESAAVARFRRAYEAWNPNEPLVGLGAVEEAFLELRATVLAPQADSSCWCSDRMSGGLPCLPDKCPNSPRRRALFEAGTAQLRQVKVYTHEVEILANARGIIIDDVVAWAKRVIDWDAGSEVQGLPALLKAIELDLNTEHERALLAESNNDIAVELMAKEHATSIRCQARSAELESQVKALRSSGATPSYRVFHPTGRQSWFVYHAWLDYWCMVWDQIKPWRHGSYRLGGWGADAAYDAAHPDGQ